MTLTASQRTAVENAAARWESLVTADLSSIPWAAAAGSCGGATVPALNETVDDLVIYLEFVPIDGVGGILGSAGPCLIRGAGNLPFLGGMKFDTADLTNLEAQGRLEAVIVHEMGHVLGIGTLWNHFGLLNDPTSPSPAPINDTWFSGAAATAAFNSIGGAGYGGGEIVPVENNNAIYGTGSLNGHWRESVFTTELMTPSIGVGASPLSVVTSESLSDLGYAVDSATADPFTLSFDLVDTEQPPALLLIDDIWMGPIEIVDTAGKSYGQLSAPSDSCARGSGPSPESAQGSAPSDFVGPAGALLDQPPDFIGRHSEIRSSESLEHPVGHGNDLALEGKYGTAASAPRRFRIVHDRSRCDLADDPA